MTRGKRPDADEPIRLRDVALLGVLIGASVLLALWFRPAVVADQLHDPAFASRFREFAEEYPPAVAVRVRSDDPLAAARLSDDRKNSVKAVIRPDRAHALFERGRLLYATKEALELTLAELQAERVPSLPAYENPAALMRDPRGPYACDVVLRDAAALEWVRGIVPDAELSGEFIQREQEAARGIQHARVLLMQLVAAGLLVYLVRRTASGVERRLGVALFGAACLVMFGWGLDVTSILAIGLLAVSPAGGPALAMGAIGLFFPALAVRRLGFLCLVGAIFRPGGVRAAVPASRTHLSLALGLAVAPVLAVWLAPPDKIVLAPELEREPAFTISSTDALAEDASALRAREIGDVIGDQAFLPPATTRATRRLLRRIYRRADTLAKRGGPDTEGFAAIRSASAREDLYLTSDLRMQLRTTEKKPVLTLQGAVRQTKLADVPELSSFVLYRVRGQRDLNAQGRLAGALAFLLATLVSVRRDRAHALRLTCARALGLTFGVSFLHFAGPAGLDVAGGAPACYLLLFAAAVMPVRSIVLIWALAALVAPTAFAVPAAAAVLVALVSSFGLTRSHREAWGTGR